jgi:hypothetical protein
MKHKKNSLVAEKIGQVFRNPTKKNQLYRVLGKCQTYENFIKWCAIGSKKNGTSTSLS